MALQGDRESPYGIVVELPAGLLGDGSALGLRCLASDSYADFSFNSPVIPYPE